MHFTSPPADTRRFSTPRLYSYYGYDHAPIINDALLCKLPPLRQRTGRLIQAGKRVMEIWSPNSNTHPFLPGLVPPEFRFIIPPDPRHRRYDGHLGRFDYTVSPQMFRSDAPWRGYILRAGAGTSLFPEFQPIHHAWTSPRAPRNPLDGRLDVEFVNRLGLRIQSLGFAAVGCNRIEALKPEIWHGRPALPSSAALEKLQNVKTYEQAVDLGTEVQRHIRDFDAWCRYVHLIINNGDIKNWEAWLETPLTAANDAWIGAWINGAEEREIWEELRRGMPCFIVHELSEVERFGLDKKDMSSVSLVDRTDAARLHPMANDYDIVADSQNIGFTPVSQQLPVKPPAFDEQASMSSSSFYHGWPGRYYSGADDSRKLLSLNPAPTPNERSNPSFIYPTAVELPPLRHTQEIVHSTRLPWIRPPPVQKAANAGEWTHWVEDSSADVPTMSQVGKNRKDRNDEATIYFDRVEKRRLYFDEPLEPAKGVVSDISIFGLPAPAFEYRGYRKSKPPTLWLYEREHPSKWDIGRQPPTPDSSLLPLLNPVATQDTSTPGEALDYEDDREEIAPLAPEELAPSMQDVPMQSPRGRSLERTGGVEENRAISLGPSDSRPTTPSPLCQQVVRSPAPSRAEIQVVTDSLFDDVLDYGDDYDSISPLIPEEPAPSTQDISMHDAPSQPEIRVVTDSLLDDAPNYEDAYGSIVHPVPEEPAPSMEDVSMQSPRGRLQERHGRIEKERPISLGPSDSRRTTASPVRRQSLRSPPTASSQPEVQVVIDSPFLRVANFPSQSSWTSFLTDLRSVSSQRKITLLEVARTHREEGSHLAWVSVESEDDSLRVRGHYAGRAFETRELQITGVSGDDYRDMVMTAAETWRPSPIAPPIRTVTAKRSRLPTSPRRNAGRPPDGGSMFRNRPSISPPPKRPREADRHCSPPSQSRLSQPRRHRQSPPLAWPSHSFRYSRSVSRSPSPSTWHRRRSPTPLLTQPALPAPAQPVVAATVIDPAQWALFSSLLQRPAMHNPVPALIIPLSLTSQPNVAFTPAAVALGSRLSDSMATRPILERMQISLSDRIGDDAGGRRRRRADRRSKRGGQGGQQRDDDPEPQDLEEGELDD